MAVATFTIEEALDAAAYQVANLTWSDLQDPFKTQLRRAFAIAVQSLSAEEDRFQDKVEGTLSLVDGTSDYDLPDDFRKVHDNVMYYSDTDTWRCWYITEEGWSQMHGDSQWQSEGRPRWFRIVKVSDLGIYQARFEPTPDTSYTANFTYYSIATDHRTEAVSGDVDERWPLRFMWALVWDTLLKFPDDLTTEQIALFRDNLVMEKRKMNEQNDPILGGVLSRDQITHKRGRYPMVVPPETLSP